MQPIRIFSCALALLALELAGLQPTFAAPLASATQQAIRAATFEVVMKKPEKDSVTYDKPLPLDLLPYIQRTDKYQSIGTAFAIGNNQYVTAAHVLQAGVDSQFGVPALRNAAGTVYAIDRILKYSGHQDFVVFSLRDDPAPPPFAVNAQPKIDDPVLAVGNALGEGIVIRDGLYTSATAEEQDGRWKWIRFSAAASPGNSGGPLLDADGRVIGIVIGKSPNENLNFSLPISQVLEAPLNRARFERRILTSLPFLQGTATYELNDGFDLPLSWGQFALNFQELMNRHDDLARANLLKINASSLFPKGSGAESILYAPTDNDFEPRFIAQQADGSWVAHAPRYTSTDLGGDGAISLGASGGLELLHLERPNNDATDAFYRDSKAFMDLVLKGLDLRRVVGTDRVRVTSLGPATSDTVYEDHQGRKWQERIWPVPFMDVYLLGMLLPTPDGYVGFMTPVQSAERGMASARARLFVEQIDTSLTGTLAQWRTYLARKPMLPRALADITLSSAAPWQLRTKRFTFSPLPNEFQLNDKSVLSLTMGFLPQGEQAVWSIADVWWHVDSQRKKGVGLWRRQRPPDSAKRELRSQFDDMRARRAPFDGNLVRETASTYLISSTLEVPAAKVGMVSDNLLYGLTIRSDALNDSALKAQLQRSVGAVQLAEKGADAGVAVTPSRPGTPALSLDALNEMIDQSAREFDTDLGRDLRGRVFSDDLKALVHKNRSKFESLSGDPANLMTALRAASTDVENYWKTVPGTNNNRDLWGSFLALNGKPADLPHGPDVLAKQQALLDSLRDGPSPQSAELGMALTKAYVSERRKVSSVRRLTDSDYRARAGACPAPATRTSGTARPRLSGTPRSLEEFYPPSDRRRAIESGVIVSVRVAANGCAMAFGVASSSGSRAMDEAALKFMQTAEFVPAEKDGVAVDATAALVVKFSLYDD